MIKERGEKGERRKGREENRERGKKEGPRRVGK